MIEAAVGVQVGTLTAVLLLLTLAKILINWYNKMIWFAHFQMGI